MELFDTIDDDLKNAGFAALNGGDMALLKTVGAVQNLKAIVYDLVQMARGSEEVTREIMGER